MSGYHLLVFANGDALTSNGDGLFGSPSDAFNLHQHFKTDGEYIVARENDKVLDVSGEHSAAGSHVGLFKKQDRVTNNQSWVERNGYLYTKLANRVLSETDSKGIVIDDLKPGSIAQTITLKPVPEDVPVNFTNKTAGTVNVYLVHNGEVQILQLAPNQTLPYTALKGSKFDAKDSTTGELLEPSEMIADTANTTFEIFPAGQFASTPPDISGVWEGTQDTLWANPRVENGAKVRWYIIPEKSTYGAVPFAGCTIYQQVQPDRKEFRSGVLQVADVLEYDPNKGWRVALGSYFENDLVTSAATGYMKQRNVMTGTMDFKNTSGSTLASDGKFTVRKVAGASDQII